MRALTFQGPRDVRLERVPDPRIVEPTDALVRVKISAICGSDLHVYHERERGQDRGTVMGHEFVGEVVETGADVRGVQPGHVVLSPFTTSCGRCFYCRAGLSARCEIGQLFGWVEGGCGLDGGQAELVRVPLADGTLLGLPEGIAEEEALLLGDVLSTGYFCARQAGVVPEGTYAVVGCGPVGLMAIVGVRILGAERIYAVDTVAERLELARSYGAEPIDASATDPAGALLAANDGRGADAVLEAVGSPAASRTALSLVRAGGTISIVGVHNEPSFSISPTEAYDRNLTLRIGRCPARSVLEDLLPAVRSGRFDLTKILTHRFPLERGAEGYRIFDEKQDGCIKVVLSA